MSADDDAFLEFLEREFSEDSAQKLLDAALLLRSKAFKDQLDLIQDPARFKVALCPRRVGKTTAVVLYLIITALENEGCQCRYVTDTRDHAKKLIFDELLAMCREAGVATRTNVTELVVEFPNRSKIFIGGAETEADIERYRGFKNKLFVIDEAASIKHYILDSLISKVVIPSLTDAKGTLCLTGTPGAILGGTFYKITGPRAFEAIDNEAPSIRYGDVPSPGITYSWSFHSWGLKDNTAVPHLEEEVMAMKKRMGWSDSNPIFIREVLGRWAADDDRLVFKFDPTRNTWNPPVRGFETVKHLPKGHVWRLLIGMDMGFHDPFALQVFAYSATHPNLYQVYEFQQKYLTPPKIAAKVKEILAGLGEDNVDAMIADYSGLGGDSLKDQFLQEYGLLIEAAERKDKRDHIELFNGDLVDGRVLLLEGSALVGEVLYLSWDDTGLKEKAGQANHQADATVYIWRFSQHRFFRVAVPEPEYGSKEWELARSQEEDRLAEEYARRQQSFVDDFDTTELDTW